MRDSSKNKLWLVILFSLLFSQGMAIVSGNPSLFQVQATEQTQVDGLEYAPYIERNYYYESSNTGYNQQGVYDTGYDFGQYRYSWLQYAPDENGVYQFVIDDSEEGTTTYVYQITADGIYEQAYFETDNQDHIDYRYHADAMNNLSSLILPANLYEGLSFQTGYRDEERYIVLAIHDDFTFGGENYQDVVELRHDSGLDSNWNRHIFLAPEVGLVSEGVGNTLTMTYEENIILSDTIPTPGETSANGTVTEILPNDYAVSDSELSDYESFYVHGHMMVNRVDIDFINNQTHAFLESGMDGSYDLIYSTNFELSHVDPVRIDLSDRTVYASTMLTPTFVSNDYTSEYRNPYAPIYLFYNRDGGISMAFQGYSYDGNYNDIYYELTR